MKFHLDENMGHAVAHGLRQLNFDVTTTQELLMDGSSDNKQLLYCIQESRVIVTSDTDFLSMHASGQNHPGIVFVHHKYKDQIGKIIRYIQTLSVSDQTLIANTVHYCN